MRALHRELVSDLTAKSCLAALERFFYRCEKSRNIYSGNGTNFIKARKEITEIQAK